TRSSLTCWLIDTNTPEISCRVIFETRFRKRKRKPRRRKLLPIARKTLLSARYSQMSTLHSSEREPSLMYTTDDFETLIDDLAAHWTDQTLAALKAAGVPVVTVDMEIAAWRILKRVLRVELKSNQALRLPTLVSLSALMERVL